MQYIEQNHETIIKSESLRQHVVTNQPLMISNLSRKITGDLISHGVSIVHSFPMNDFTKFNELAQSVITYPMNYKGGTNSREDLGGGTLSVGTEPPDVDVPAHNEMSYWHRYPEIIMFGCKQCPDGKGPTVIANNLDITKDILSTSVGRKFKEQGVKFIRNFYNEDSKQHGHSETCLRSWQQAFGCSNKSAMIKLCEKENWGYSFTEKDDITISYKLPAFEFDPALNENLFFVPIGCHGYAFDHWAPYNSLENHRRPYHLTYGDGSELSTDDINTIEQINDAHGIPIFWENGKILIVDNRRYTHARPPYKADPMKPREIGVRIGNPIERYGQREITKLFSSVY
ncbi:MAG: TauD/TfdA family dioxygenase [Oligoflexales bacterium]|nr:TauD/TfdA family dioxygenase [Oligoflexales bacterium]